VLKKYRNNNTKWLEASYKETKSESRGSHDKNEKTRYAIFLSLQYDLKDTDEELVRYLYKEEIKARENDDFQGIGESLWLASYLLSKFKNPKDILLFHNAKHANFDTACGFDREFIYITLRSETEDYIKNNYPEIFEDVEGDYEDMDLENNLDSWYKRLTKRFPDNEKDEHLLDLFERCIFFDDKLSARKYLEKWKSIEPESENKNSNLKYAYLDLGDYDKAVDLLIKELKTKETSWDIVSASTKVLKMYTKMKSSQKGFELIKSIDEELKKFDDWLNIGLGRILIHEAFEFSIAIDDIEITKQVFNIVDSWFKQMDNIAYVGLKAGLESAKTCGYDDMIKKYGDLAKKEKARIDGI